MWSSSVCLKLMLLLPKELWTWAKWSNQNHYRVSFVMRQVLHQKLRSDLFWLLDWDAVTTMTLYEGSHLDKPLFEPQSLCSCVMHRVGRDFFYYFYFFRSLARFYLDGGDCMTSVCSFVWKWSPVHCTVTGLLKHFNIFVFVWKKRLDQKHSDSEQTLVHRQATIQECVVLVLCFSLFVFVTSLLNWSVTPVTTAYVLLRFYSLSVSCYDVQWCSSTWILFLPVHLWLLTFMVVFFETLFFFFK